MNLIVQKFGGTSVATSERRMMVAQRIVDAIDQGYQPVVVVSAIGRSGDPYATDTLIDLATSVHSDINIRELDLLMSCGEIISGVVMANTLKALGYDAVLLTGGQAGICTNDQFGNGRILEIKPEGILNHLNEGKIVIVAGFQGQAESGEVVTLGRGGSDTTASALGVALNAELIEIYTDVEGIMTADPRLVPDAQILDVVTYGEVCEMAYQGATVIHPRAVEVAMQKGIPLRIRSTFTDGPGTLITNAQLRKGIETTTFKDGRIITGIAQITKVAQLHLSLEEEKSTAHIKLEILKAVADAQINIDLINVLPTEVAFIVKETKVEKALEVLKPIAPNIIVKRDCAKISVVGATIEEIPGVMAGLVEALNKENVNILQTSDSNITISCLIKGEDTGKSLRALHQHFISDFCKK